MATTKQNNDDAALKSIQKLSAQHKQEMAPARRQARIITVVVAVVLVSILIYRLNN